PGLVNIRARYLDSAYFVEPLLGSSRSSQVRKLRLVVVTAYGELTSPNQEVKAGCSSPLRSAKAPERFIALVEAPAAVQNLPKLFGPVAGRYKRSLGTLVPRLSSMVLHRASRKVQIL